MIPQIVVPVFMVLTLVLIFDWAIIAVLRRQLS
jgi:hypothetical protein